MTEIKTQSLTRGLNQGLTQVSSVAAVLDEDNIDTDIIYPGRFLTRLQKAGMSECLFYDRRFDQNQLERPEFVLNRAEFKHAKILISGNNFGCGSSRETAVWALKDYGFLCVIARSFGEIFYRNCISNRVLPIVINQAQHGALIEFAELGKVMTINVVQQAIELADQPRIQFDIAVNHRHSLLTGLDEISLQLENDEADIAAFEAKQKRAQPWLWQSE